MKIESVKELYSAQLKSFMIAVIIALVVCPLSDTFGQDETLLDGDRSIGYFVGLNNHIGSIGHDIRSAMGAGLGLSIADFFVGAYGMGTLDLENWFSDVEKLEFAHAGLWLGYQLNGNKMVHPYFASKIGWGAINFQLAHSSDLSRMADGIFVIVPEAGVELNINRWFKLAASMSYRIVSDVEKHFANRDFTGLDFGLTLRFGKFVNRIKRG